jgi:hypothetical protein
MQLLAAVNRAVRDQHHGLMRTKHLHSEIVYALAGTQNVPFRQVNSDDLDYRGVQNFWLE